jgi:hypothetical protein
MVVHELIRLVQDRAAAIALCSGGRDQPAGGPESRSTRETGRR